MKRTFLKFAALAAVVTLAAGCATGVKHSEMATQLPKLKAGEGRVYFIRASSALGAAIQPDLYLNGQVVGTSKPGGFFYVDRRAGNYVVKVGSDSVQPLSFALRAGETKYVRSSIGFGLVSGQNMLELETPEKAKAELNDLAYTGPVAGK